MSDDVTDDEVEQLWRSERDPRIVRSISEVAAEAELRRTAGRPAPRTAALLSDAEIASLDESDLEALWPRWGERRTAQLGRGIPPGLTITPQHLPHSANAPVRSL